ncbi:hypothetical protein BDR04DRAFT_1096622 [Suillus decipiens]|nr:hypothetical protein BDR04DRAFT_1096622 [Suillus decipiens]
MSEQEVVAALRWNNNAGVPIITLMLYEYLLLLDKEINYVWVSVQPRSPRSYQPRH